MLLIALLLECINMNLRSDQEPKSIQVYKGMGEFEFEQ